MGIIMAPDERLMGGFRDRTCKILATEKTPILKFGKLHVGFFNCNITCFTALKWKMSVILGHIHRKQSGDLISSSMNKENNHYIFKVYEQIVGTSCTLMTHWMITHFFNCKKSTSLNLLLEAFNFATDLVLLYAKLS